MTTADRVLTALVLLALVGVVTVQPACRAGSPRIAGLVAVHRLLVQGSARVDPWGHDWRVAQPTVRFANGTTAGSGGGRLYSVGPNGRDELGAGDDVELATSPTAEIYEAAPTLLLGLVVALLLTRAASAAIPGATDLPSRLFGAAIVAIVPTLTTVSVWDAAIRFDPGRGGRFLLREQVAGYAKLLVSTDTAFGGTLLVGWFLLVLAHREFGDAGPGGDKPERDAWTRT